MALFLWELLSPRGALGRTPAWGGWAARCLGSGLGHPGAPQPCRGGWFGEMGSRGAGWRGGAVLCAGSLWRGAEVGPGLLLGGEGFCLSCLLIWESGSFPLCIYLCGKRDPRGLYLTLAYAKMQRAGLFSLSPFYFFTEEGVVIVS